MANRLLFVLALAALAIVAHVPLSRASSQPAQGSNGLPVARLPNNPLLTFADVQLPCDGDYDINFPSIVRTPSWFSKRLGEYYMYFSDHHGLYIYMAYSNSPKGPWVVLAPPVLTLAQVYAVNNNTYDAANVSSHAEVASPDAYVDNANRRIILYVHRRVPSDNFAIVEAVAFSTDGLHFTPRAGSIGQSYMRHFTWHGDNYVYLVDRYGNLLRSLDGYTNIQAGNQAIGNAFANQSLINGDGYTGLVRHVGVSVVGNILYIFGTRVGDAPESILWTSMDLRCTLGNFNSCQTDGPAKFAFGPVYDYEGANYPNVPSKKGSATGVNQIRDPFVFADAGKCYIFYAIAGESGFAAAYLPNRFCYSERDADNNNGGGAHGHRSISESAFTDASSASTLVPSWVSLLAVH